ncbi:cytochrome P450 [Syncephalis plumigaleata]|nr:cytochrome P450 [Syncephalis plumigaleata]
MDLLLELASPKTVWICDADIVRKVLGTHYYRKDPIYNGFRFGGHNIFSTRDVDYHRIQKRLMSPAYTPNALNNLEPMLYDIGIRRLADVVRKRANTGEVVDLLDLFHRMTFDVIGEVAFGKTFDLLINTEEHHPIIEWLDATTDLGVKKHLLGSLFHPIFFPSLVKSSEKLLSFAKKSLDDRRAIINCDRMDTLQQMITSVDVETGATMSDQDIISNIILLMVAGTDTTALTLTWTMYLLLKHPNYMEQLVAEVESTFPDPNTKIDHAATTSMPFLEAVLRESMRLRPILPHGLPRVVPEEGVTLGGHYLPGGTSIFSSFQTMHMNPDVFPDPTAFIPERWLTSSPDQLTIMQRHWLTFSIGPRACIGRNLAWMELRLAIVELLRYFQFTLLDNDMRLTHRFVLRPVGNQLLVQVQSK